ncbi:hypothetical protein BKA61DRAFT_670204 [Leptodontidium sp. MPI-SDFR-AT-0119]|nr:hypothetical protein BKA61DRAFT_670204 [Leptodontidium sp. MPI-SDFR-AT-0119]
MESFQSLAIDDVAARSAASLAVLDEDIMIMIFDLLFKRQESARRMIQQDDKVTERMYQPHKWRLVCRQWDQILIPIVYAKVDSGYKAFQHKLDPEDETYQRILMHIRQNARHVTVHVGDIPRSDKKFKHEDTVKILSECGRLKSITCHFTPLRGKKAMQKVGEVTEIPEIVYDAFLERPDVQVLFDCPSICNPVFPQGFQNLVSIDVALYMCDSNLQSCLVDSPNIQKLHLKSLDRYAFKVSEGRLPPLKELKLWNYQWSHSPSDTALIWDFSKLETLILLSKKQNSNRAFLVSALSQQFPQLKKVDCRNPTPFSYTFPPSPNIELGEFIVILPQLEDLTIFEFSPAALVPFIAKVGPGLKKLRMQVGTDNVLRTKDLQEVQKSCPNIETLGVHRDPAADQADVSWLFILCQFEKLSWLKLEYRSRHHKMSTADGKKDYHYVLQHKRGTPLLKFQFVGINSGRRFEPELMACVP